MISTTTAAIAAVSSVFGLWAAALASNVALVLAVALPFKWLWNASLPALFSATHITYAQSSALLGVILLARVIVRGVKLKLDFRA